jgi:hypothetical protein
MIITKEIFTEAINKIESDTNVQFNFSKDVYISSFKYSRYNIEISGKRHSISFNIKTTFNSHQILTNTIILQDGMFYSPLNFIQEPNLFFLYIRGIADEMVNFHFTTISLDNFEKNIRNKKLNIITSMNIENDKE